MTRLYTCTCFAICDNARTCDQYQTCDGFSTCDGSNTCTGTGVCPFPQDGDLRDEESLLEQRQTED